MKIVEIESVPGSVRQVANGLFGGALYDVTQYVDMERDGLWAAHFEPKGRAIEAGLACAVGFFLVLESETAVALRKQDARHPGKEASMAVSEVFHAVQDTGKFRIVG